MSKEKHERYLNALSPDAKLARNRKANLKKAYGISPEQYDAMFDALGGACAICERVVAGKPPSRERLHVDHDHETGKIRGLLCGACNVSLGGFRDDPELLAAAIRYLMAHGATIVVAA